MPSDAAPQKGLIFLREHRKGTLLLNDFPIESGNGAIAGGTTAIIENTWGILPQYHFQDWVSTGLEFVSICPVKMKSLF